MASHLLTIVQAKTHSLQEMQDLFQRHPDYKIFVSLPGAGRFLAPALLSKFGDDRDRFRSSTSMQALAGTCPVTDQSGKHKAIKFRRACDHGFRQLVQQGVRCSLSESVWANAYWQQIRPLLASDNHAYRCLGNRLIAIAWKLWQTRQSYDQTYHLQQRAKHAKLSR